MPLQWKGPEEDHQSLVILENQTYGGQAENTPGSRDFVHKLQKESGFISTPPKLRDGDRVENAVEPKNSSLTASVSNNNSTVLPHRGLGMRHPINAFDPTVNAVLCETIFIQSKKRWLHRAGESPETDAPLEQKNPEVIQLSARCQDVDGLPMFREKTASACANVSFNPNSPSRGWRAQTASCDTLSSDCKPAWLSGNAWAALPPDPFQVPTRPNEYRGDSAHETERKRTDDIDGVSTTATSLEQLLFDDKKAIVCPLADAPYQTRKDAVQSQVLPHLFELHAKGPQTSGVQCPCQKQTFPPLERKKVEPAESVPRKNALLPDVPLGKSRPGNQSFSFRPNVSQQPTAYPEPDVNVRASCEPVTFRQAPHFPPRPSPPPRPPCIEETLARSGDTYRASAALGSLVRRCRCACRTGANTLNFYDLKTDEENNLKPENALLSVPLMGPSDAKLPGAHFQEAECLKTDHHDPVNECFDKSKRAPDETCGGDGSGEEEKEEDGPFRNPNRQNHESETTNSQLPSDGQKNSKKNLATSVAPSVIKTPCQFQRMHLAVLNIASEGCSTRPRQFSTSSKEPSFQRCVTVTIVRNQRPTSMTETKRIGEVQEPRSIGNECNRLGPSRMRTPGFLRRKIVEPSTTRLSSPEKDWRERWPLRTQADETSSYGQCGRHQCDWGCAEKHCCTQTLGLVQSTSVSSVSPCMPTLQSRRSLPQAQRPFIQTIPHKRGENGSSEYRTIPAALTPPLSIPASGGWLDNFNTTTSNTAIPRSFNARPTATLHSSHEETQKKLPGGDLLSHTRFEWLENVAPVTLWMTGGGNAPVTRLPPALAGVLRSPYRRKTSLERKAAYGPEFGSAQGRGRKTELRVTSVHQPATRGPNPFNISSKSRTQCAKQDAWSLRTRSYVRDEVTRAEAAKSLPRRHFYFCH